MSKTSGKEKTTSDPWIHAQPYIKESMQMAQNAAYNPPKFYGDKTYVDTLPTEQQAWNQRLGYTNDVFRGAPTPQFGDLSSANSDILRNGTGNPNQFAPDIGSRDYLTQRSYDPRFDVASFTPSFGQAGGLDARGAYGSMLNGKPDYEGVQGAITAANAPLMRDFEQNYLPGVAGRAGISGHDTGSIKLLNRGIADLGERMSTNAMGITEGERLRALGAQERAAGAVTQGGMQGYGLGLSGAQAQVGANQGAAQFGANQDLSQANLNAGYRSDLLQRAGIGGTLANQSTNARLQASQMWPQMYELGTMPGTEMAGYGAFQREGSERALDDSISRWDFEQNEPRENAAWYSNIMNGMGGLGTASTTSKRAYKFSLGDIISGIGGIAAM